MTTTRIPSGVQRQNVVVVLICMLQQTLLADRAFDLGRIGWGLWLAMVAACLLTRLRRTPPSLPANRSWINSLFANAWWLAAVTLVLLTFQMPVEAGRSAIVGVAQSLAVAMMLAQVILVTTHGFERMELLVAAVAVQVLSLVCTSTAIPIYRQVAEASAGICLFAMMSGVVAGDRWSIGWSRRKHRFRSAVVVTLLLIVTLATRPIATAADGLVMELQLQLDEAIFESEVKTQMQLANNRRYVDSGQLNDVVEQYLDDPRGIAIRVFSDYQPGYLRGRAFDLYRDGAWFRNPELDGNSATRRLSLLPIAFLSPIDLPLNSPSRDSAFEAGSVVNANPAWDKQAFELRSGGAGRSRTIEVQNNPARGQFYFLPLNASRLDGKGRRLIVDSHQIPLGGLDTKETYLSTIWHTRQASVLEPGLRQAMLQVPQSMPESIRTQAKKLRGPATSSLNIARRISDFLQQSFTYSTDRREIVNREDPVAHFLRTRHPAHCEYFASATTLMLRSLGIPARYVTGYVVDEVSEEADYWLARNNNAHAWVEAFDDDTGHWFVVESTPGKNYSPFEFTEQSLTTATAAAANVAADNDWFLDRFHWFVLLRNGRWTELMVAISESARWPLALLTLGLITLLYRGRARPLENEHDPHAEIYRTRLLALQRSSKRLGIQRMRTETLHQFATRIEAFAGSNTADKTDICRKLASDYRTYADCRYQGVLRTTW